MITSFQAINDVLGVTTVRQPRGQVTVNGLVTDWISFEVDNNTHYKADTFRVELPLNQVTLPLAFQYLASQSTIEVSISAGFSAIADIIISAELTNLIIGNVDDINFEPSKGIVSLSGRDLSALLMDAKTTEQFKNKTSSQIATILAGRHGLTPVVTATKTLAGKYYEIDHARLTNANTEWDLLTFLAQEENFDAFVIGKELHFQPRATAAAPYLIQYFPGLFSLVNPSSNVTEIAFTRNLTLAKDIKVIVKSWNQKQKKGFTVTATASHTNNSAGGKSTPQTYSYTIPNLTKAEAQVRAQNLLAEISKHEYRVNISMPADVLLTKESLIQIVGTVTDFDTTYYPSSINRRMSMDEGFRMDIEAKNHSPDTEVTIV